MSRRRQQEIRTYMRQHGVTYNVARQAVEAMVAAGGGSSGPPGPSGPGGSGWSGAPGSGPFSDGWPAETSDIVVAAAIGGLRSMAGNALPQASARRFIAGLLAQVLDQTAVDLAVDDLSDVMVNSLAASPTDFPYLESGNMYEYEYGLSLDEVTLGFVADLEVVLMIPVAKVLAGISGGYLLDVEDPWATVRMPAVELFFVAQVRSEIESAEIVESWVTQNFD